MALVITFGCYVLNGLLTILAYLLVQLMGFAIGFISGGVAGVGDLLDTVVQMLLTSALSAMIPLLIAWFLGHATLRVLRRQVERL